MLVVSVLVISTGVVVSDVVSCGRSAVGMCKSADVRPNNMATPRRIVMNILAIRFHLVFDHI